MKLIERLTSSHKLVVRKQIEIRHQKLQLKNCKYFLSLNPLVVLSEHDFTKEENQTYIQNSPCPRLPFQTEFVVSYLKVLARVFYHPDHWRLI